MGKFIMSRKTLEFVNPESGEVFRVDAHYVGSVPEWVEKQWLFQAAIKDATITFVGENPTKSVKPEDPDKKPKPAGNP